ncbi:tyrosine recombinase XerC [Moraxella nasovis]|uniref:tyrosine recombinase XerC n=1 Tax=Moraxella nasovis TaxID=2904121 RepID=UPI002880203A|nr:tyrosine recombinase XerC [Moraxella nasovis]
MSNAMRLSHALTALPQDLPAKDIPPKHWAVAEAWLDKLSLQNYSAHTVDAYRATLWRFLSFIDDSRRLKGDYLACDKKDLATFLSIRLERDGIKPISAKQEISAIRKFYAHLIENGKAATNPTTGYRLKSDPRALPKIVDVDLMAHLLDQPMPDDASQARLWVRDRAMFELMYSSGLRLSELVGLDTHDINLKQGIVRVLGKGNKQRIVPIGQKAIDALTLYLPHRDLWQESTNALFVSERHGTRLSTRAVQLRLKTLAKNAGIDHNLYPHLLRHCFASHLLSSSGDLRAVQEMLGHSDISTTQIYTQVDFKALTQVYDKTHPRAIAHKLNTKK